MSTFSLHIQQLIARVKKENVFFLYSFSSLALQASVMIFALISLRYVPPELMGIWQTLTLISTYGNILNLGITRGLSRELPFFLGRGEREKAWALAATAQTYTIFVGFIGSVGFIGAAIFARPVGGVTLIQPWLVGLVGMGLFWFTSLYRSYLAVTFRAEAEFRRLAYWQLIESMLNLASMGLVLLAGYYGLIVRYMLVSLVGAIALHLIRPVRVPLGLHWPDFKLLLQTGVPQYISNYLVTISLTFDQTIILQRSSVENVGLYTPVAAIIAVMLAIRGSITSYVNPQIAFRLGKRSDPHLVGRGVLIVLGLITAVNLPIILVGFVALPLLISGLFPQYEAAIVPAQITLLGGFFLAIDTTQMGLYILKTWRYMAVYALAALALRWSISWIWTQQGDVLVGVAAGSAVANVLLVVIGLLTVWAATRAAGRQQAVPVRAESELRP